MIRQHFLLLVGSCILSCYLLSCEEIVSPSEKKAVIEGTFNSGGYPTILFSSSVVPGIDGLLSEAVINWGRVTISDGEKEVVLTGYVDHNYLPPFRYTTIDMQGEPGKKYKITADFLDLHAESTVEMPYPVGIDSVSFALTEVDTLRATTLHFTSPSDTPAFFYLTLQQNVRGAHPNPCLMGTIRTDIPNYPYSIAVLKPKFKIDIAENNMQSQIKKEYVPQLTIGEEWTVRLNRVEEKVYDFWKAYDNMILFSTSPFISTSESLPSNIEGGYGIWSPQGSALLSFKVI